MFKGPGAVRFPPFPEARVRGWVRGLSSSKIVVGPRLTPLPRARVRGWVRGLRSAGPRNFVPGPRVRGSLGPRTRVCPNES